MIANLFLPLPISDVMAQFLPQSNIKNQSIEFLDITDAVYNAYTSEFLGSKNLSSTPQITEEYYTEDGFLDGVGNVTNKLTFENAYLSDELTIGKGKGTIETTAGQKINWISSDIGTLSDNQWLFYGVILFNNTHYEPLSSLNNTLGLYKSTPENPRTIWLWK